MALSNAFVTIGVSIVSFFVYILSIGYRKRSMINELRKQGVVGYVYQYISKPG